MSKSSYLNVLVSIATNGKTKTLTIRKFATAGEPNSLAWSRVRRWSVYDCPMYEAFYLFCQSRIITQREQWQQAFDRVLQAAQDGTDIELSPNDIATAKLYVRARALKELNSSIDTLVEVRDDPDAKGSERIKAAETLIARAIGPVEAPNSIPFAADLSQASPTEIIDALIESVNTGAVSATFASTIRDLLSAKVQSQKLEDIIAARSRTIEHVPKNGPAPNGHAPVATPSAPPVWARRSQRNVRHPPLTNKLKPVYDRFPSASSDEAFRSEERELRISMRTRATTSQLRNGEVPTIVFGRAFARLWEPAEHKAYYGGRGSGKTHHLALYKVIRADNEHLTIACMRQFQNSIHDSSKKVIEYWIDRLGLSNRFKSTDQEIWNRSTPTRCSAFKGWNATSIASVAGRRRYLLRSMRRGRSPRRQWMC